jgi:hypothetical protein
MLRRVLLLFSLVAAIFNQPGKTADSATPRSPLWLYEGSWQVNPPSSTAAKPYQLTNDCAQLGLYFACQQSIDGKPVRLLVMIATENAGHFHTQTILPGGRATGLDDLEISGNQWVFTTSRREGGKTTYYRTINTFSGKARIHFEQAESTDGKQWITKSSGDQAKLSTGRTH